MTTTTPAELERADRARALRAALLVAECYDRGRAAGYMDLGRSRRERALYRLEREATEAVDAVARDLDYNGDAVEAATAPSRGDVVVAFRREVARRMARVDGRPRDASIRNALRRAAVDLGGQVADGKIGGELSTVLAAAGLAGAGAGFAGELERIRDRSRSGRQVTA